MFTYDVAIIYAGPIASKPQHDGTSETKRISAVGPSHAIESVLSALPQADRRRVFHLIVNRV